MASLFRPTVIRYTDKAGNRVSKDTPGAKKVREKSKTWRAKYTDAQGHPQSVSLFDDKDASKARLAAILHQVREEQAGIVRPVDPYEAHQARPLSEHVADWEKTLRSRERAEKHVFKLISYLSRVADACGWKTLADVSADDLEHYLHERRQQGMSIAASNDHIAVAKNFGNWLIKSRPKRAPENPFTGLGKLNAHEDVRLVRRPATVNELRQLLAVCSTRKPFRSLTGPDRAMLYHVAVETGFRASELASLTVSSLDLDATIPSITVEAGYSKRRRRDVQPIRQELAELLRAWLRTRHSDVLKFDETSSTKLWPGTWFQKAANMLQRDLDAAGVEVETEDGRIDFHCLRRTFATNLARAGVSPKASQELMRHSDINLTMTTYTNFRLSDVAGDIERLPNLDVFPESLSATGTTDRQTLVAPMVALDSVQPRNSQALSVHVTDTSGRLEPETKNPHNLRGCEGLREPVSTSDKGPSFGFEPKTYALRKRRSTN